jgi:rRNA-processing protein CGR1
MPAKAFRPASGLTSFQQREKARVAMSVMKAKEKEMKEEKETERIVRFMLLTQLNPRLLADWLDLQQRVQKIKDRRAAKDEKERYAKMAEKMHKKRIERLKRKEKRNKLINS